MTTKDDRTVNGFTYSAQDICPDIDTLLSDVGACLYDDIDWFPAPEQYGIIASVLGDNAILPDGIEPTDILDFLNAVAKDYVGYKEDHE